MSSCKHTGYIINRSPISLCKLLVDEEHETDSECGSRVTSDTGHPNSTVTSDTGHPNSTVTNDTGHPNSTVTNDTGHPNSGLQYNYNCYHKKSNIVIK